MFSFIRRLTSMGEITAIDKGRGVEVPASTRRKAEVRW